MGLLDSGPHEDHAEFHGGFEDEFAVALRVGGIVEGDELVGDDTSASFEIGNAGAKGFGRASGAPGGPGCVKEATEGFEDFGGVLGDDADGRAIDDEAAFADGGLDGKILPDG